MQSESIHNHWKLKVIMMTTCLSLMVYCHDDNQGHNLKWQGWYHDYAQFFSVYSIYILHGWNPIVNYPCPNLSCICAANWCVSSAIQVTGGHGGSSAWQHDGAGSTEVNEQYTLTLWFYKSAASIGPHGLLTHWSNKCFWTWNNSCYGRVEIAWGASYWRYTDIIWSKKKYSAKLTLYILVRFEYEIQKWLPFGRWHFQIHSLETF